MVMSKIIVEITGYTDMVKTIGAIIKVSRAGLAAVKRSIENKTPVYQATLFCNDHDDVSDALISLIKNLNSAKAQFRLYEVEEGEIVEAFAGYQNCIISPIELLNILQRHDEEIERQQK